MSHGTTTMSHKTHLMLPLPVHVDALEELFEFLVLHDTFVEHVHCSLNSVRTTQAGIQAVRLRWAVAEDGLTLLGEDGVRGF